MMQHSWKPSKIPVAICSAKLTEILFDRRLHVTQSSGGGECCFHCWWRFLLAPSSLCCLFPSASCRSVAGTGVSISLCFALLLRERFARKSKSRFAARCAVALFFSTCSCRKHQLDCAASSEVDGAGTALKERLRHSLAGGSIEQADGQLRCMRMEHSELGVGMDAAGSTSH